MISLLTCARTFGLPDQAEKKFIKPGTAGHGHAVERHFSVISRLAGDAKIPAPVLWPGPVDRDYAERICRQLPGQKWLCVGPGANWSEKIWPAEKYAKLIDALAPTFDGLVLLGNEADNAQARHIARRAPLPWLNLCGQTTILEAVAVLERMTLSLATIPRWAIWPARLIRRPSRYSARATRRVTIPGETWPAGMLTRTATLIISLSISS